jgi:hypothetical protein
VTAIIQSYNSVELYYVHSDVIKFYGGGGGGGVVQESTAQLEPVCLGLAVLIESKDILHTPTDFCQDGLNQVLREIRVLY